MSKKQEEEKLTTNTLLLVSKASAMAARTILSAALLLYLSVAALAEDPYHFFDWKVTYGNIAPLGVPKEGILINGQFPGPTINCTSNNNIIVNVFNYLDEPLLITWNGIQQRKNSWMDGTPGTMCPILPRTNFTYKFQVKDQIGTFFYFPTTMLQRADGGMGILQVHSRPLIPVPFDWPSDEFRFLIGDWYNKGHKELKHVLDSGRTIGLPDGIHINGKSSKVGEIGIKPLYTINAGKTYRFRMCNVGMRTSVNIRMQRHTMKLVEMEGSHTVQNVYESLDLHVGQCLSVLVTADQTPMDYYFAASSRFIKKELISVAVIRYENGNGPVSETLPPSPPNFLAGISWSINQFRSFRWNLTASAARPNPQGSYKYGKINITRTIRIANSRGTVDGKVRYAINGVSHIDSRTPLKLAEYFEVPEKAFRMYDLVKDVPAVDPTKVAVDTSVVRAVFRNFVEIIFENTENTIQTWHLDGYAFFAVAMEPGVWSPEKRRNYNLEDAVSRYSIQVYPKSWAAVMTTFDNAGMWNLRSEMPERAYLGQQLYFSVVSEARSLRDEHNMPPSQLLCGAVMNLPLPAPYS